MTTITVTCDACNVTTDLDDSSDPATLPFSGCPHCREGILYHDGTDEEWVHPWNMDESAK
jgi:hypothetical protein